MEPHDLQKVPEVGNNKLESCPVPEICLGQVAQAFTEDGMGRKQG